MSQAQALKAWQRSVAGVASQPRAAATKHDYELGAGRAASGAVPAWHSAWQAPGRALTANCLDARCPTGRPAKNTAVRAGAPSAKAPAGPSLAADGVASARLTSIDLRPRIVKC